jgi:hypothetical protein
VARYMPDQEEEDPRDEEWLEEEEGLKNEE